MWKVGLGSWHAAVRGVVIAFALIALLAGCVPVPAAPPTPVVPATVAATTEATTAPAATSAPTEPATVEPTAAATAAPTAAVTQTVTPTVSAASVVVQKADRSIQRVDLSGNAKPLYQAADLVDVASIFPPANVVSNTLFLPFNGAPGSVAAVDPQGDTVLPAVTGQVYGLAVNGGKLAYGAADLSGSPIKSEIRVAGLDGSGATTVYSQTMTLPQVLRVMRWSADGKQVYFGKEPVGLGGYILFGGLTNLWALDVASGQASELVRPAAPNAAICIDDLSADGTLAADHCNGQAMEVIEVATGVTRTVAAPAGVPAFAAIGGARFSPDGKTLAFAMARRNPDDEQGWVAVADVAGGASKLIATSPTKDYFSVVGFLDADTLLLQSSGQVAGVWTVDVNGQNLKRVTDGVFLGLLNAQP